MAWVQYPVLLLVSCGCASWAHRLRGRTTPPVAKGATTANTLDHIISFPHEGDNTAPTVQMSAAVASCELLDALGRWLAADLFVPRAIKPGSSSCSHHIFLDLSRTGAPPFSSSFFVAGAGWRGRHYSVDQITDRDGSKELRGSTRGRFPSFVIF